MLFRITQGSQNPPGGWPTFGAVISKRQGARDPALPPFVGLEPRMKHRPYNAAQPGFCGVAHKSFRPEGDGKADMTLNGISLDRLKDRMGLLKSFDQFRRDVDAARSEERRVGKECRSRWSP